MLNKYIILIEYQVSTKFILQLPRSMLIGQPPLEVDGSNKLIINLSNSQVNWDQIKSILKIYVANKYSNKVDSKYNIQEENIPSKIKNKIEGIDNIFKFNDFISIYK